jgi:uncharacterized repeat protein (TIGR02543 family)
VLQSIAPNSAAAGGPGFTLWVNGTGFASGATVLWNGSARPTSFFSTTHVRAEIPASDIAAAGTAQVSAANPGGAPSGTLPFTISGGGTSPPPPPPPAPGPTFTLTVTKGGSAPGRGTVSSNPAGISCGDTCSAAYASGSTVTLTATVNNRNGIFAGWGGACSGTGGTCTVTMDASKTVTATFNRR